MPTNVVVPALGDSINEAVLLKWHIKDGDAVAAADPVAEMETDKANVDVPSPVAGVFRRVKKEGDTVKIGDTIAVVEENAGGNAKTQAPKPVAQNQRPRQHRADTHAASASSAIGSSDLQARRPPSVGSPHRRGEKAQPRRH